MELARHLRSIKVWTKKVHTERGYFLIERGIFVSAFIVRKLIENKKVTDNIRNRSFNCQSYNAFRPLSDRVSRFNGIGSIDREYDLSKPSSLHLSFYDLASEIMHSYVFVPEVDDQNRFVSFFINSYRGRDDRVLSVSLDQYQKAVELVVADSVVSIHVWKDPKTGRIYSELN